MDESNESADRFDLPTVLAPEPIQQAKVSDPTSGWRRRVGLRDIFPLFDGDSSLAGVAPISANDRARGFLIFFDYDSFMGVPDSGWTNNGLRTGFNFATRLGPVTDLTGIHGQVGASIGVYDLVGTDYRLSHKDRAETQGFFTYGLYRKPTANSGITGGLVQDWSVNNTYGIFGENPVLSQLRGQLGYAVSGSNEFGVLGATHLNHSTRNVPSVGETTWQSISQLSGYWHHKWFAGGPDTWLAIGGPSPSRLAGGGSVADYLVTAAANCPLSNALAIENSVTYMHPSSSPGPGGSADETWNFSIGLVLYPGRNARSQTVAGQQWMPLMPVANNGSFLVDTNKSE